MVRSQYPAAPAPPQQQQQASQFAVLTSSGRTLATADTYRDMLSAARTAKREEGIMPAEDARVCPYCGKVCDRPSTLKTHLNSHTGERPYTCYVQGCGRQFTVLSNMYRHAKTCTAQQQQQFAAQGPGAGSGYGGQQAYQSGSRR
ncbi:hypothetical protein AURDEDRAFT_114213 [Auricularia subglabra TFB-10046 SS5]|nr:hypothetical protein AURDEDRAFT_114213 [Auricularia subglabra TFB-10046 SS5]